MSLVKAKKGLIVLVLVSDEEVVPDHAHVHQPATVVVQHRGQPLLDAGGRQHTLELSEAWPHGGRGVSELVRVTSNTERVSHSSTNMVTRKSDSLVADMDARVHLIRDVTTIVWHLKTK